MNAQAAKLIRSDQEPLIALLDAQTSLLEGDHETARQKFEAMLDDPEMRLLGLRGLYLEAERLGDRAAARHFAGRAAEVAPQLNWASVATLEERTERGDWDGALKLLDGQKAARQVERDVANRRRAVLLTAKAMSLMDTDPTAARNAALEANRLAPELVPAAATAARALFRQNDVRKGAKLLEASWKVAPHPEIGDLYVHARPGDATHDRLARARTSAVAQAEPCRNRRWSWRVRRWRPANMRRRARPRNRRSGCSRAKAPICCSPTSRRPMAATRARSGNIWRGR